MLRTELIELVNHGQAWAFIGAGISADAGAPSWRRLLDDTIRELGTDIADQLDNDEGFTKSRSEGNFPKCFLVMEAYAGHANLEAAVRTILPDTLGPGQLSLALADWPFAGYITTNYDSILEQSLSRIGQMGWASIGNRGQEPSSMSGNPERVVWHVHGSLDMDESQSQLVLTEDDYDQLYLEDSPVSVQLRALLLQRRVVFFGYGFQDPELNRLLRLARRYCNPARPAYAFLSGLAGQSHDRERRDLLERYNIDVIPYNTRNGSHEQLQELIKTYSAFALRRSLRFGQNHREVPSYDPETTSLLTYNALVLRNQANVSQEGLDLLLRARVLSMLNSNSPCSSQTLSEELASRTSLLHGQASRDRENSLAEKDLARVLSVLMEEGLVLEEDDGTFYLSPEGVELVGRQAGSASLLSRQFKSSLLARAEKALAKSLATKAVAETAAAFLQDCIRRRALGVAMAWNAPQTDIQQFHLVALLQSLPDFMEQLDEPDDARALVEVVENFLASPTEAEAKYLGLSLQAQFSLNLLGYDPELYSARAEELGKTLFLIDADTLIPLLGRSSKGYSSARTFVRRLKEHHCGVATTDLLSVEVGEHARWPIEVVGRGTSVVSPDTLLAATGRAGFRSNVFLQGFLKEASEGTAPLNYGAYLDSALDHPEGHKGNRAAVRHALGAAGVACVSFSKWEGFTQILYSERDEVEAKIRQRRIAVGTFRHQRQVQAEAEALLVIAGVRKRILTYDGKSFSNAYFVSHSRVVDRVSELGLPITIRPEALIGWLNTLSPTQPEELTALIDGLLWELSERGFSVVEEVSLYRIFSPLVQASRKRLEEELAGHRNLISTYYGESAKKAFQDLDGLNLSIAIESLNAQQVEVLERELARTRAQAEVAKQTSKVNQKERRELQILRAKDKEREARTRARKRAAESKRGKRTGSRAPGKQKRKPR